VVRSLTPKQVEALRLRVQGLSTKEIAEKLGSSQRTIERWQLLPEFCEVFERSTQSLVNQLSEDWLAQAQTTSESHTNAHQLAINLALNGLKKIKQKLDDSDCDIEQIDIRRLNWLSMILDRHIQGQRISYIVGQDGAFLGEISSSRVAEKSICNQVGAYGSQVASTSIRNKVGDYGSQISKLSAYSPNAQNPPILIQNGQPVAVITKNRNIQGGLDPDILFYSTCEQANALTDPNSVVVQSQLENLTRNRQTNAESINQAMKAAAEMFR